ncbi:MAG: hypothetical protein ACXVLQ_16760 [Bacteriovorax sp.]
MKTPIPLSLKLVLSNLTYSIPILALAYYVIAAYQENISFAEMELKGNSYQMPIEQTLQLLGRHSWLTQRSHNNDSKAKEELKKVDIEIDAAIGGIDQVQKSIGEKLQFTNEGLAKRQRNHFKIDIFKKEWSDLKSQQLSLTPSKSLEKHAHLIADLRGMITHLGDTSNLILDPDLDSYYLMDVTLLTLPQMQNHLIDIIIRGEKIVRSKTISADDRKWLVASSALLKQSDLDRFVVDIQTALNEDRNFFGISKTLRENIPSTFRELKGNIEQLIKTIDNLANSTTINISVDQFTKESESAFYQSFAFWNLSKKELDNLLSLRMNAQRTKRNQALIYCILALAFAAFISTILMMSIRSGIAQSIAEATRQLSGTAEETAELARLLEEQGRMLQNSISNLEKRITNSNK